MMNRSDYLKSVDELLDLTQKALYFIEKKDLSRVYKITEERKKLLSRLKFKSAPFGSLDLAKSQLENIQEIDASIKAAIEKEISELLDRVYLIKKELKLRDRFVGSHKGKRKLINGQV